MKLTLWEEHRSQPTRLKQLRIICPEVNYLSNLIGYLDREHRSMLHLSLLSDSLTDPANNRHRLKPSPNPYRNINNLFNSSFEKTRSVVHIICSIYYQKNFLFAKKSLTLLISNSRFSDRNQCTILCNDLLPINPLLLSKLRKT